MSIIQIRNLTKRYGTRVAVDNVNINIEEGQLFGLLGPNGAGKSTTISMVSGLIKPDGGDIVVGGYSIVKNRIEAQKSIGSKNSF